MVKAPPAPLFREGTSWPARLVLALLAAPLLVGPNGYLRPEAAPTFYDYQRLLELFALLTLGASSLLIPSLRQRIGAVWAGGGPWAQAGLGLFFALGLASALTAPVPRPALLEWSVLLIGMVAALGVAAARSMLGREGDLWLLAMPAAGIALYAGQFLNIYLPTVPHPDVTIFWVSPFYHFGNVRFLNQFQTWTMPLLVGATLLAGAHSRTLQGLLILIAGFWWSLLLASGGRGTLLAITLAGLITLLIFRGQATRWALAFLGVVAVGGLLYLLLFQLPGGAPGVERAVEKGGSTDHARLELWGEALRAGSLNPFLGLGPMQLAQGPSDIITHPHNALLQLFAEWGAPATVLAVSVVLAGVFSWGKNWRPASWQKPSGSPAWAEGVPPAVTAALLGGLGHGLVSGTAVMPMSQSIAVVVVGWVLGIHLSVRDRVPVTPDSASASSRALLMGLWVTGLVALTSGIGSSLPRLSQAHESYAENGGTFHPRLWYQGNLCLPPWSRGETAACPSGQSLDSPEIQQ